MTAAAAITPEAACSSVSLPRPRGEGMLLMFTDELGKTRFKKQENYFIWLNALASSESLLCVRQGLG